MAKAKKNITEIRNEWKQELFESVMEQIEQGQNFFDLGFSRLGAQNPFSGARYRGANVLHLTAKMIKGGFKHNLWATWKQIQAAGYSLCENAQEYRAQLFHFSMKKKKEKDENGNDQYYPSFSYFNVFNADAIVGFDADEFAAKLADRKGADEAVSEAESYFLNAAAAMGARVETVGDSGHYIPALKLIQMPSKAMFDDTDRYLSVCFHELGHATKLIEERELSYSAEEMVAESFSFLMSQLWDFAKAETETINHKYLANWGEAFRNKPEVFFQCFEIAEKMVRQLEQICPPASVTAPEQALAA